MTSTGGSRRTSRREEHSAEASDDDSEDDADDVLRRPHADPDSSAPPLATAERPPGQEPRTRDLRADED